MDPSFIDLREECSSLSGRRNGNPVLCSKAEMKKKRKREASASYLLKESSQLDQNEPWVEKYSPRSQVSIFACHVQTALRNTVHQQQLRFKSGMLSWAFKALHSTLESPDGTPSTTHSGSPRKLLWAVIWHTGPTRAIPWPGGVVKHHCYTLGKTPACRCRTQGVRVYLVMLVASHQG